MTDSALRSVCRSVIDSAPSLGVYYFFVVDSVCPYVCMSVTLLQTDSSSLFLDGVEPFWHVISPCGTLQNVFFSIFDLGFLTPKIYSPKFATKSRISRLVRQTDRRCLGLLGGFRGWPIQWNHTNSCGPTLVAIATKFWQIWAIIAHAHSNRFFFFSRRNRAIFGRQFSMWHSTKRCSSIFDLGPLTLKI